MTVYVDSSVLVAIYIPERFSEAARSSVRAAGPVPFTALHQLEVSNAFELLLGRKQIKRSECRAIQAQLHSDVQDHRLVAVTLDLDEVFAQASELSRLHAARRLARSLDLLHVAAAHVARCTTFVSADDRQLAVAKASGLTSVDIKRRSALTGP
ncbi:MAG: type II toxin-antitoxin system VapC family toxin [Vicinamibacteraceae bacterium]